MNTFSFKTGFNQVQTKDAQSIKTELMKALNIKNRTSWGKRLNGKIEPKASQIEAVEKIFNNRGIVKVWGDE